MPKPLIKLMTSALGRSIGFFVFRAMLISFKAKEILDSRGNPTIEVDVELDDGIMGRADVAVAVNAGRHSHFERERSLLQRKK